MEYKAKDYDNLIGMPGFSEGLLKNHFALYQGYVKNVESAESKRRFGWEFDGMRLHEYYFENLSKTQSAHDQSSTLHKKFIADFGSHEKWEKDFRATGAMRGVGWAVLYYDKVGDRLFNCWINEHDTGHLAGCLPILVMDVFEHAYMLDYGTKKPEYINAFFNIINWPIVEKRFSSF